MKSSITAGLLVLMSGAMAVAQTQTAHYILKYTSSPPGHENSLLYQHATNNNIGIGTTSPNSSYKLDIAGTLIVDDVIALYGSGGQTFIAQSTGSYAQMRLLTSTSDFKWFADGSYNRLRLWDGNAAADRMVIDSAGNVGIDVTAPAYQLEVGGDGKFRDSLLVGNSNDFYVNTMAHKVGVNTNSPGYALDVISASAGDPAARLRNNGSAGQLLFYDSTSATDIYKIGTWTDVNDDLHFSIFSITPTAAHRFDIDEAGEVGIGTVAQEYRLQVGNCSGDACAAKPNGGTWTNPSDARLKTNIRPLTGALDMLVKLEPVEYEWINTNQHDALLHAGFIAQEVEFVFPDWVGEVSPVEDDASLVAPGEKIKNLYFPHDFNAYVVQAFKEVKEHNESLGARVSDLERQVWMLKAIVCVEHPLEQICNE